ncbi:MAG: SDR family oxidoreductase [Hyphomonadaceae bacterium]|nr:SDR family oxidoreductase [Hyphomonadaceae bacterium]
MQGKVVVITGATSGLGKAGAEELARRGARIVFTARSQARAEETLAALKQAGPGAAHRYVLGDLSTLAEMKRVGAEIAASEPKIDVLANNAGAIYTARQETVDGLELTFATNHMSYFIITNALLPALKATPGARVVSTASGAHHMAMFSIDDLQLRQGWTTFGAYGASKLCNILFTRELAKRLQGSGVTANCFHPGFVASGFAKNNGFVAQAAMFLGAPFALTPAKGADTLIYLATSPDVANVSGKYFARRRQTPISAIANDDAIAAKLWAESERIANT